jgi:hypothetical protein
MGKHVLMRSPKVQSNELLLLPPTTMTNSQTTSESYAEIKDFAYELAEKVDPF